MAEILEAELDPPLPASRRKQFNGELPKVTPEILDRIAQRRLTGRPLSWCLALEPHPLTVEHWNEQLSKAPILARHYQQRLAIHSAAFFDMMNDPETKLRTMPAQVWLMERAFPEHFAQPKAGGGNAITFNGPTQINVQHKGALKSLLRRVIAPPKPAKVSE